MNDRELLELAAKAAGIKLGEWAFARAATTNNGLWAPLDDDGDALRLAVKLNLHICIEAESAGAIEIEWGFDEGGFARHSIEQEAPMNGDDYAATRRAIVRAAAEIGETGSKLEKSNL